MRATAWLTRVLVAGAASALPALAQAQEEYSVSFLGRSIDLRPYVQGFPYSRWSADYDAGVLLYFQRTEDGTFLLEQDLGEGLIDPEAGRRLSDIDWSQRGFWGSEYHENSGDFIILADERNDEVFNLYRMSLTDGSLEKLTDVPYIYGWDLSKDGSKVGYIARYGSTEPYRNCLTVLDLETGDQREAVCEEGGSHRMVWTTVNWRPDGSGAVIRLNKGGHRKQGTLAYVDLTATEPTLDLLLPDGTERFSMGSYEEGWLDNDRFLYVSDESGYANVYVYDLSKRRSEAITEVEEQAWFMPIEIDDRRLLLINYDRPHENVLSVLNPETGQSLGKRRFDANLGIIGFDLENRMIMSQTSAASPFRADELIIGLKSDEVEWSLSPKIRLPESYANAIEQCKVERVVFPTFDTDPETGEHRKLHAFLMTPKNPRDNHAERLAVITSFYGGGNSFRTSTQIACEAGISWLSPAVRGSSGFGKDFMALNDRDLGGDEIIDLFYGARFLEDKLDLEPQQIGVAGGSHGGYATMRALTFPSYTNDRNESYDFGFGMSHAGFSSIVSFYDATNIPDWIILEAGDPEAEREKLLDRSPLSHVDLLDSPILLTHGSNDSRVEVTESRQFVEAARELDKPVTYVEFEGQGHGVRGLANLVRYYQTRFDFLTQVVCNAQGEAVPACRMTP